MRSATLVALAIAGAAVAFAAGRWTQSSSPTTHAAGRSTHASGPATHDVAIEPGGYADGYHAGREAAFRGFDGGWAIGDPYIVVLRRGPSGTTYKFARRWALLPGHEYRACHEDVICSRPAP